MLRSPSVVMSVANSEKSVSPTLMVPKAMRIFVDKERIYCFSAIYISIFCCVKVIYKISENGIKIPIEAIEK